MSLKGIVIMVVWGVITVVIIIAAVFFFNLFAELLATVVPVALGIVSTLFAAIFQFALAKRRELDLLRERMKQDNYMQILDRLAEYVRGNKADNDKLASAHLATWVVGSSDVVRKSSEFMKKPSNKNLLKELVLSMREDAGRSRRELENIELVEVFEQVGHVE